MITPRSLDRFAAVCAFLMALVSGGPLSAAWASGQEAESPPAMALDEPADTAPAKQAELPPPATEVTGPAGTKESRPQLARVYRLRHADAASVLQLLRTAAPDAEFALDHDNRSLIVVGSEQSHEAVADLLSQLDVPREDLCQIKIFRLVNIDADSAAKVLHEVLPSDDARIATEERTNSLILTGSEEALRVAEAVLLRLDEQAADAKESEPRQLLFYPLRHADAASVLQLLRTAAPDAEVTLDNKTGSLLVLGSKQTHEVVENFLRQLDAPPEDAEEPQAPRLEVHQLSHGDPQSAIGLLASVAPEARVSVDPKHNRLLVWGPPQAHEKVRDFLAQLDTPPEDSDVTKVFRLKYADPDSVGLVLSSVFSAEEARIAADQRNNAIIVTSSPEKLKVVEDVLSGLDEQAAEQERPYTRPATFRVRIVWLAGGLPDPQPAEPSEDLKDVVAELSKVGVTGLRQVGQAMVNTTPDGSFQVCGFPNFGEQTVQWEISGELSNLTNDGAYDLSIQLAASRSAEPILPGAEATPERQPSAYRQFPPFLRAQLADLDVQISASVQRYVVLGVTPIGSVTSAFVVQVSVSEQ